MRTKATECTTLFFKAKDAEAALYFAEREYQRAQTALYEARQVFEKAAAARMAEMTEAA
jgi:hypothetical protein